ncbi:hypothetical protein, partial [Bacillus paralicheniformis]|uniref:hypothetical protein n=1 Tax=Bacillus paralicheniformis TaxID=1648923 RepID=UPI0024BDD0AA
LNEALLLLIIQLQRLEQSVVSLLHSRQKAPRNQEFQHPRVLSEPLPLLLHPTEQHFPHEFACCDWCLITMVV